MTDAPHDRRGELHPGRSAWLRRRGTLVGCGGSGADAGEAGTSAAPTPAGGATAAPKVTFVELGSDKCIPCKEMRPVMDGDPGHVRRPGRRSSSTTSGRTKRRPKEYGIQYIPTQVFLDEDGRRVPPAHRVLSAGGDRGHAGGARPREGRHAVAAGRAGADPHQPEQRARAVARLGSSGGVRLGRREHRLQPLSPRQRAAGGRASSRPRRTPPRGAPSGCRWCSRSASSPRSP